MSNQFDALQVGDTVFFDGNGVDPYDGMAGIITAVHGPGDYWVHVARCDGKLATRERIIETEVSSDEITACLNTHGMFDMKRVNEIRVKHLA